MFFLHLHLNQSGHAPAAFKSRSSYLCNQAKTPITQSGRENEAGSSITAGRRDGQNWQLSPPELRTLGRIVHITMQSRPRCQVFKDDRLCFGQIRRDSSFTSQDDKRLLSIFLHASRLILIALHSNGVGDAPEIVR